ncbi:DUF3885 domain-containing protein, partial [Staphylococcus aureus]|uniref:DUF3885 domain-containing protein n=1 Tax=Staphylococcus aureus TaxID=1280 RepID=UPI0038B3EC0A
QLRFILDWNSQATRDHISYDDRYFPVYDDRGLWLAFNNNEDYARYSEKYNDLISEFDNEDI